MARTKTTSLLSGPKRRLLEAWHEFVRRFLQGEEAQKEFARQFLIHGGQPGNLEGWIASCINEKGEGIFYHPNLKPYSWRRFRNVATVVKYLMTDYDPFGTKPKRTRLAWKVVQTF